MHLTSKMIVRAGVALEHVGREQHQLAVGVDDLAVLRDDAEAVAVAVEREAELGIGRLHGADQVGQVLGLARVGMVVREVAVDLGVQLDHVAAERAQDAGRRRARECRCPNRPRSSSAARACSRWRCGRVYSARMSIAAERPLAARVVLGLDAPAQALDLVAVDRAAGQHHLEAVVVLRVVAAGDLDAAACSRAGRASRPRSTASAWSRRRCRRRRARSTPARGSAPRQAPGPRAARRGRPRPRVSPAAHAPRCRRRGRGARQRPRRCVWPTTPRMS